MANGTVKEIPPAPWEQPGSTPPPPWEQATPGPVKPGERRTETATPGYAQPSAEYRSQQGKDIATGVARYGGPIAGGLLFPASIVAQAGTTAISEFTARQIESAGTDPELSTLWSDLQASGLAGGVDLGFSLLFKGLGAGVRKIGQRLFLPKEMPPAIQLAQDTLSGASKAKNATVSRWQKWVGGSKSRPFSLTLGQLNAEEQGFINWLEGVSRSSLGGRGMMQRFDLRNEKVVTELFNDYVTRRMSQMTDPEIGVFMERIMGSTTPGEAFKPVEAFRKYLYKQFDDGLARTSMTVDARPLRKFILERQDELISKTYRALAAEGVLPPLEAAEDITRRVRTTTRMAENVDQFSDITRRTGKTPEKMGAPKRKVVEERGVRQGSNVSTKVTERKVLEDTSRPTAEQLDAAWSALPAADADKVIRGINSSWRDGADADNKILSYMRRRIEPEFEQVVQSVPGLNDIWQTAKKYNALEKESFQNNLVLQLRKKLTDTPSAVANILDASKGDPATTYDKLMRIKNTLFFSAAAPASPLLVFSPAETD